MSTPKVGAITRFCVIAVAIMVAWPTAPRAADSQQVGSYGIGRAATPGEIRAWDIDISPDGEGLPPGQGTVAEGASVYANTCASCHGTTGIEGPMPRLIGGLDSLTTNHPMKTVGSYWPFATTLFDYVYRTMPLTAPQSLSPHQVYAVIAWLLFRNGVIEETTVLDAKTLATIQMPNRNGFVNDPRPDVPEKPNKGR